MSSTQRVMIFIDTPNLVSSAKRLGVPRLKFHELSPILARDAIPVGCFCYVPDIPERQNFYSQLERMGLHVVRVSPGKSVDGRLIFDMLVGAMDNRYDIATLCAGDRDYVQVVERVKQMNKLIWLAAFSHSVNAGLRSMANHFIDLDSQLEKIRLEPQFSSAKPSSASPH